MRALENRAKLAIEEVRRDEAIRDARSRLRAARKRLGERDPRTVTSAVLLAEAHQYGDRDVAQALREAERGLQFALQAFGGQATRTSSMPATSAAGRSATPGRPIAPTPR